MTEEKFLFEIGDMAACALMLDDRQSAKDRNVEVVGNGHRTMKFRATVQTAMKIIDELESRGAPQRRGGDGWDNAPGERAACRRAAARMRKALGAERPKK